jgi:hypothetical protein
MVGPRFVQESDVLETLDTRPSLMDLSPRAESRLPRLIAWILRTAEPRLTLKV